MNFVCSGPAPSSITEKIFFESKQLTNYKICKNVAVDLDTVGSIKEYSVENSKTIVEIVDPVDGYLQYMRQLFDFDVC